MAKQSLQDKIDIQQQLLAEQQQSNVAFYTDDNDDDASYTPSWMANTAGDVQAEALTADLAQLLQKIPVIKEANNDTATEGFLTQVIAELTKVFYVRFSLLEEDDTAGKTALEEEFDTTVAQINQLLTT